MRVLPTELVSVIMINRHHSGIAAEKEDRDLFFEEKDPTTSGEYY